MHILVWRSLFLCTDLSITLSKIIKTSWYLILYIFHTPRHVSKPLEVKTLPTLVKVSKSFCISWILVHLIIQELTLLLMFCLYFGKPTKKLFIMQFTFYLLLGNFFNERMPLLINNILLISYQYIPHKNEFIMTYILKLFVHSNVTK